MNPGSIPVADDLFFRSAIFRFLSLAVVDQGGDGSRFALSASGGYGV